MLVVERKLDETIRIAGVVIIKVVEVRGNKVKLGITAPPDVPVWREELINGSRPSNPKDISTGRSRS